MNKALPILVICLLFVSCGDSNTPSSTSPTPTVAPAAPQPVTTEFTLSARNCTFTVSRPIRTVSVGESFTIRFKPLEIDEVQDSEWSNSVQFWLDRQDEPDAIGLNFIWQPNSQWVLTFFAPSGHFGTGQEELISVGGRFREITFVRSEGVSEWLLDGVVVLQLIDNKPVRTVHTTVVGADVRFQYEETSTSTLKAFSAPQNTFECMQGATQLCSFVEGR